MMNRFKKKAIESILKELDEVQDELKKLRSKYDENENNSHEQQKIAERIVFLDKREDVLSFELVNWKNKNI